MGLLKHVILPIFAVLDLFIFYNSLIAEDFGDVLTFVNRPDIAKVPITVLETHFLHCLGGVGLILFVNNVAAIVVENSHYRGMAVLLQVLFFAVDMISYMKMGLDIPSVLFVIVGVGIVGLLIHANEPGIFTKDHDIKKKSG